MTGLLAHLLDVPSALAYVIIAALVFGEAALFVGFVLPGETAVLIGGVLASLGHLSLPALLALVVVAGVVGDSVGFEVGRKLGPRLMGVRLLHRHRDRLEQARRYVRERGGRAVVVGRFTAFLRAVTPALAGASAMSYRRFLAFNVAGGLVWGVGVTLLGYFAGTSYQQVSRSLGGGSAVLLTVVLVGLLLGWHHRRRRRSDARQPETDATHDTAA